MAVATVVRPAAPSRGAVAGVDGPFCAAAAPRATTKWPWLPTPATTVKLCVYQNPTNRTRSSLDKVGSVWNAASTSSTVTAPVLLLLLLVLVAALGLASLSVLVLVLALVLALVPPLLPLPPNSISEGKGNPTGGRTTAGIKDAAGTTHLVFLPLFQINGNVVFTQIRELPMVVNSPASW